MLELKQRLPDPKQAAAVAAPERIEIAAPGR